MDESGNKENDRFFVCGFLEVLQPYEFSKNLYRVRDQIFSAVQDQRASRAEKALREKDVDTLYHLGRKQSFFELKFDRITLNTVNLYKDVLKALNSKCDFRFKAIVIDRKDPARVDYPLTKLYATLCHQYFDYCQEKPCIFVPDQFDPKFDWQAIIQRPEKVVNVLPAMSHGFLPLQIVDLLTGIVRLGLEISEGEKPHLGRNDKTRLDVVDCFKEVFRLNIAKVSNTPWGAKSYLGIWTLDFDKKRRAEA